MDQAFDIVSKYLGVLMAIGFWVLLYLRMKKVWEEKIRMVSAVVEDKFISEVSKKKFGKKTENTEKCFIIVFRAKRRKISFNLNEETFDSYNVGDSGTLKYRIGEIISFR